MSAPQRSAADFKSALVDPAENYDAPIVGFEPDDDVSLQALLAEQRARSEIIRRHHLWEWLDGIPLHFVDTTGVERGLYLEMGAMVLSVLAVLTAGFTRGPVLWTLVGACLLCAVVGRWLNTRPIKESLAYYGRSEFAPAAIVAHGAETRGRTKPTYWFHALVRPGLANWRELRELIGAATRLEAILAGREECPRDLKDFVERVGKSPGLELYNSPRIPLPPVRGFEGLELACVISHPKAFPGGRMVSRLAFVLLDTTDRAPWRTLLLRSPLWGTRADELCAHFPLETAARDTP